MIAYNTADGVSHRRRGHGQRDPRQLDPRQRRASASTSAAEGPTSTIRRTPTTVRNHRQNFPIVREVEHPVPAGAGSTRVVGKLNSAPSTTFDLDFYANPACSNFPREFVEGETWLGTSQVTTDANGDATFDVTLPGPTEAGARITVTATDPNGNTSEFSQRIIFSIFPVSGPDTGGSAFEAFGTDFADPTTITVGGVPATNVDFRQRPSALGHDARLPAGHLPGRRRHDPRQHHGHADQGLGLGLPRRAGRADLP